jgi:trk system potassium uptake protein TrkA
MRAIIVGGGDVGSYLCRRLEEMGHSVTLLENDPTVAQQLDRELSSPVRAANGSSAEVLYANHVDGTDHFFAMTSNDQVNILAASIAKRLGASHAIARIHDNTYADYSYLNYQAQFDIDLFVNPEALAAAEIAKTIRNPGRMTMEFFGRGEIEVQQMRISNHSPLVGKSLQQLHLPDRLRIAYIAAGGTPSIPQRDTVIEPYAILTLVGHPRLMEEMRQKIKPESTDSRCNVAILGANETTNALLKSLSGQRYAIKVCEPDGDVCRFLSQRHPHLPIICGKCTSLRLMEEEHIGDCEHFIASSRNDEENIMACLLAKKMGAKATYLVLNKGDYEQVVSDLRCELGLKAVVSPRVAIANELTRFTCPATVIELDSLPNRSANFYEVRIHANCACHNRTIAELKMPDGCLIIGLQHKFRATVPCAQDRILAGDRLIVIATPAQLAAFTKVLV